MELLWLLFFSLKFLKKKDISYLIDVLPHTLGIKFTDWGVCGVSLGAHTTLLAMANDPRLKVGVSIIGNERGE